MTTGKLQDATRVPVGEDPRAPCLNGYVYGDTKGRFGDGQFITTSTIMKEDGNIFHTRYSVYEVENWRDDAKAPDNPFRLFEEWVCKQPDEVQDMGILEQAELYAAAQREGTV